MTRSVLSLICFLGSSTIAHAARHEVSFEFSNVWPDDPIVTETMEVGGLPSPGLRFGWAALRDQRKLGLVVSAVWRRAQRTTRYLIPAADQANLTQTTLLDTVGLGVKGDVDILGILFPYVRADIELVHGRVVLDDTTDEDQAGVRIARAATAPGGRFTIGLEAMLPDQRWGWPVTPAIFLEGGYAVSGPLRLEDLGTIRAGGPVFSTGVGLRF